MPLAGYLHHNIRFHNIQFLYLIEALKYQTAHESGLYFLHIILKSLQGCQLAFVNLLSFSGNTNLAVGANVVQIVVKAENGTTATYKITVTRQAAGTTGSETTATGGENGDDGNG